MLQDLLLPEELLQIDKLKSAVDLCEGTSFLGLLGVDKKELASELKNHFKNEMSDLFEFISTTDKIFDEIIEQKDKKRFFYLDLFDKKDDEFIKNMLFYRDFLSDHSLKIIMIFNQKHYKTILTDAIDLYNIATFAYLFTSYKVDLVKDLNKTKLYDLLQEYKEKKKNLNAKQKISFLMQISTENLNSGKVILSLKYGNEALKIASKLKNRELKLKIKYHLANNYRLSQQYKIAEKYLLEAETFFKNKKQSNDYKIIVESLGLLYFDKNQLKKALLYADQLNELFLYVKDLELELASYMLYISIYEQEKNLLKLEEYLEKASELAKTLNSQNILANFKVIKARKYIVEYKYKSAIDSYNEAVKIYKKEENIFSLGDVYLRLASLYFDMLDYDKSLIYCEWCFNYFKENNQKDKLLDIIRLYSVNYKQKNDFKKAINKLEEALKIDNKQVLTYMYLSDIYYTMKEYDDALYQLDIVHKIFQKSKIKKLLPLYSRYANIYKEINKIDKAYEFYEKALELLDESEKYKICFLKELYGEILVKDDKFDEAVKVFQEAIKIAKNINDLSKIISIEENLAHLYKNMNKPQLAKRFFMEVIMKLEVINKKSKKIKSLKQEVESLYM